MTRDKWYWLGVSAVLAMCAIFAHPDGIAVAVAFAAGIAWEKVWS